jgi:hypothetical protein
MAFGMNVIHTTNEVPALSLPLCYQPTKIHPGVSLHKYELRVTFEPNPHDPFAEPLLYEGIAATPRWLEDWTGWVGRAKFNDNFIVRPKNANDEGIASSRVFEFLMAGGDHAIQRACCDLDALRPLSLSWSDTGEWIAPPLTPFVNPLTGERHHFDL